MKETTGGGCGGQRADYYRRASRSFLSPRRGSRRPEEGVDRGPAARAALPLDRAAPRLDDPARDREAEPGPPRLGRERRLEEPLDPVLGEPHPLVEDRDPRLPRRLALVDPDHDAAGPVRRREDRLAG